MGQFAHHNLRKMNYYISNYIYIHRFGMPGTVLEGGGTKWDVICLAPCWLLLVVNLLSISFLVNLVNLVNLAPRLLLFVVSLLPISFLVNLVNLAPRLFLFVVSLLSIAFLVNQTLQPWLRSRNMRRSSKLKDGLTILSAYVGQVFHFGHH